MKFEVGDKVQVREWDDMKKEFGVDSGGNINTPDWCFIDEMIKFCGKTYIISQIRTNGYYLSGCGDYIFTDEMLIQYEFTEYEFTESDLKTGMIVETRCHESYMVYDKRLINTSGYEPLINYTIDLYHRTNRDFDIIRVFNISNMVCNTTDLCKYLGDLLWERKPKEPEEKVISSDEAFKVLKEHYGCDVKIGE